MTKSDETGGLVSPENLWGKPLKRPTAKVEAEKVEAKVTGMRTEDDDMDEDEIDVDDELAEADEESGEEETDDEYVDVVANGPEGEEGEDGEVDEDGLTYSPEAGDESAEDEGVVSAVDDDEDDDEDAEEDDVEEDAVDTATTTESRNRSMADKKKVSLSDHVRAEIEKRKNAGASLRGVDIVAALEKRNITVSPAQVSQLLKKAGLGGAPRGRKPASAGQAPAEKSRAAEKAKKHSVTATARPTPGLKRRPAAPETTEPRAASKAPAKAGNGFRVPMDQLQAVETFVKACGGSFASASRILTAAQQLSETFGG